jgi:hypothetical protein
MLVRATLIITLAALVFARSASACLWDTRPEVEKRYGKPIGSAETPSGKSFTYKFKQFIVMVEFLDGRSQNEHYFRYDNKQITPEETQQLLSMNAREHTWRKFNDSVFALVPNAGGRAVGVAFHAVRGEGLRVLTIRTSDFDKKFDLDGNPKNAE